jgi:hypothetical protein
MKLSASGVRDGERWLTVAWDRAKAVLPSISGVQP